MKEGKKESKIKKKIVGSPTLLMVYVYLLPSTKGLNLPRTTCYTMHTDRVWESETLDQPSPRILEIGFLYICFFHLLLLDDFFGSLISEPTTVSPSLVRSFLDLGITVLTTYSNPTTFLSSKVGMSSYLLYIHFFKKKEKCHRSSMWMNRVTSYLQKYIVTGVHTTYLERHMYCTSFIELL